MLVDATGLNPASVSGKEASDRIINAAIIADLVFSTHNGIGILTLLADKIAGIEKDAYYSKSSVEECENSINGIVGYVASATIANVLKCDVQKDPVFVKLLGVGL